MHWVTGRKVAVRAGADQFAVGLESAFDDDDGLGSGVAMPPCHQAGRVPHQVVLRPRRRILIEEPQGDRAIVDGRLCAVEIQ